MSAENRGRIISLLAGADLSAKQYCHVKMSANRTVVAAGNGQECVGILQDNPNVAGHAGAVMVDGVSKVLFGGTVAAGGYISADASGFAVAPATGERITGLCIVGGASGEIGEALIGSFGAAP